MIKQGVSPDFGWNAGRSFIKLSKGKLELLEGDNSYLNLLEIKDNELAIKKEAKLEYEIQEIKESNVLKIFIATYQDNYLKEQNKRKYGPFRRRNKWN